MADAESFVQQRERLRNLMLEIREALEVAMVIGGSSTSPQVRRAHGIIEEWGEAPRGSQ